MARLTFKYDDIFDIIKEIYPYIINANISKCSTDIQLYGFAQIFCNISFFVPTAGRIRQYLAMGGSFHQA